MRYFSNLFGLHNGEENRKKVQDDVLKNISFKGANLWILASAILIASIGLNVNSTAVIIGAMLISPLMGPIVGAGFALATYDFILLRKSAKNLIIATVVSLFVSTLYFYLSPFKEVQSELLARTSPTIYDVLIAFFGGIVGAVSITRAEKGNPIPGVAIATALMPPLCTAGFGLATLNFKFMAGALYLYSINCFFIGISTFLIIKYMKYGAVSSGNSSFDKKLRISITLVMLLMIIPSSYLAYNLLNERKFSQNVEQFLKDKFYNNGYITIYKKVSYNSNPKSIELAFLSKKFDSTEIKQLNNDLKKFGIVNTKLIIKQNTSDLKSEILSEINKQSSNLSEKDLQLSTLSTELKNYRITNPQLIKEITILFPEISEVSLGKIDNYYPNDSMATSAVLLYKAEKKVDEEKLKKWLQEQLQDSGIKVLKE
ncbi:DUF389 domain-containing protein [Elizabethkingia anophelis]|uniref:DUF389 domain-containing protein n=1 Tax=Elizabethkingia anophelis TaxID=1117645 RepID=A0A494J916_9FLAO|nr:DUF389 domain-containing protein [Elizabethkingia anophelis]AQX51347.1 hypothetical protein AYC66_11945 [Elizabethkingia anophelis]MCT4196666.1 DUF389 domain-containing protein [Elizabethkingia anophelis]MCT4225390.1 DUF389 domain-containing protein [Elizabethkingia anophelis]MCT4306981.1 DUF389 domain-containing protein [Elizabethkingia anophelis]MDV2472740.1 DUF389 domain-containing protein [Elizabethkingia anophelis]